MTDRTVGIVGLGIMGGAIARNLVERGWRVIGFDTEPRGCASLRWPASTSPMMQARSRARAHYHDQPAQRRCGRRLSRQKSPVPASRRGL